MTILSPFFSGFFPPHCFRRALLCSRRRSRFLFRCRSSSFLRSIFGISPLSEVGLNLCFSSNVPDKKPVFRKVFVRLYLFFRLCRVWARSFLCLCFLIFFLRFFITLPIALPYLIFYGIIDIKQQYNFYKGFPLPVAIRS